MKIGNHNLDRRVLIVAEIGNNHEGSLALAEDLIGLAAQAGADAVKFQTIVPERLVAAGETGRLAQLRRLCLPPAAFAQLAQVARQEGVLFLSTPFDLESVEVLRADVDGYKIASGDLTFHPLIARAAATGLPLVISTGASTMAEVSAARDVVRHRWLADAVDPGLALLHCVMSYPAAAADANLRSLQSLAALGETIGYSDHVIGADAAVAAVALGARLIEKHFTLDKAYSDFRDHSLAADPRDLAEMVRRIRITEELLGDGEKRATEAERETCLAARRSIVAARDIPAGTVLGDDDLTWLRPGGGLSPTETTALIGRRVTRPVAAGEALTLAAFAEARLAG